MGKELTTIATTEELKLKKKRRVANLHFAI